MAMVTEFVAAVNQICSERGIDPESVFNALESAVSAAYKREYGLEEADVTVEMDRDDGSFKIVMKKTVVKTVENEDLEISLEEALKINDGLEAGDIVEIEQHVEEFGRIAAQTAKQVIMQQIRESEKDAILAEYSNKVGEVFTAMMHRMQGGDAIFEIGKAMASMPSEDQVSNEFYRIGDRYKVLLKGIEDSVRGKNLIVSRSAPEFLMELFRMEVPEIESGVVEIKACAREAGSRSKMAVLSTQDGVDAIGSCVGQRGVRIANVMSELGEEKIDIIEWREDLEEFVAKALSPAQVISVEIDDGVAVVEVEEDQLSLAIGKDGQNVRLAAKLTGLKIDIQGPGGALTSKKKDDSEVVVESEDLAVEEEDGNSIDPKLLSKIEKAGKSIDELDGFTLEQLMELDGIGKVTAEKILEALNS
jgi:N utilization substance protein A